MVHLKTPKGQDCECLGLSLLTNKQSFRLASNPHAGEPGTSSALTLPAPDAESLTLPFPQPLGQQFLYVTVVLEGMRPKGDGLKQGF